MKRRKFLQNTLSTAVVPLVLNSLPISVLGQIPVFGNALNQSLPNKILVLIQLYGGNDGLNTLIPLDQYPQLINARKNILIPENKVLPLNGTSISGLHPSMAALQGIYNSKMLTFIQGVSYPDPDLSHFRGAQIKLTGSDSKTIIKTGWVGRYLEQHFPDFPKGYPKPDFPDPPAIKIGAVDSASLQGTKESMGMVIGSAAVFNQLATGESLDLPPQDMAGAAEKLIYIGQTTELTQLYSKVIKAAAEKQSNLVKYPPPGKNPLADQLKMVAQLIGAGLSTKVYVVSFPGFDTHHSQVDSQDTTTGSHAVLLKDLSESIATFMDDLHQMGKLDNVMGMTFSEFGRRIKSNDSFGSDHGTSEVQILFGPKLKQGIVGKNPEIPKVVTADDNLQMQHDFRSVYSSLMKGWFGVPDDELLRVMLGKYPILDLFKS